MKMSIHKPDRVKGRVQGLAAEMWALSRSRKTPDVSDGLDAFL
jgi:hypothetical protein